MGARILNSRAYKKDGLLIVTFDEGNLTLLAPTTDAATGKKLLLGTFHGQHCCDQKMGPNVTRPYTVIFKVSSDEDFKLTLDGYGGDRIGAVLISPFIKPGTVSDVPYNHYSLLRSLEDIFHLDHLGYAGQSGLNAFGEDIFGH